MSYYRSYDSFVKPSPAKFKHASTSKPNCNAVSETIINASYTFRIFHQGPTILFIFIHWKYKFTNQNEIHCYRVCIIIDNVSTLTLKKTIQATNTNQNMLHLFTLFFKIIESLVDLLYLIAYKWLFSFVKGYHPLPKV